MDTIDPTIKNLVSAIGKAETGNPSESAYTQKGASGEFGRYQFMPATWNMWAKESGVDVNDKSISAQNKVAYNKVKQWKDQGLTPAQIASKWNSGDENAYKTQTPGVNKFGVSYDTPGYTMKVSKYYKESKGGTPTDTTIPNPAAAIANGTTTTTPVPTEQPKKDLLQKATNIITSIFPGKQVGELLGGLYDKLTLPEDQKKFITLPSALQVGGDIAQGALMVGAGPALKGASTLAKIGIAGAEGAGFGLTGSVAEGKPVGEVAKDTAIGGALGLGLGALTEGAIGAYKGVRKLISGVGEDVAQKVLNTTEKDVGKLTTEEQKLWYKTQSDILKENADKYAAQAKIKGEEGLTQINKEIQDFKQTIGQTSVDEAMSLKQPAQQLMKDSSAKYVELTGEAADESGALAKKISGETLTQKINSKFEYEPEMIVSLRNDLGINAVTTVGETKIPDITNQEILDKAREIMQTVSKTARQGNKVYTPAEYDAMKKYSFLMETLGENGVDMTAANKFWREWAPTRDKIVSQIKPFDEGIKGTPIAKTIQTAKAVPTTAKQVTSQIEAQRFITELESRLGVSEGTIGSDVAKQLAGLDKAKLTKTNITKITNETLKQIKADKTEALKTMSLKKFNTEAIARKRAIIKKVILWAVGLTAAKELTKYIPPIL